MKERLSVYLDPHVMRSLIDYADRRGKSKSLVAEAAIASFLSPDAAERQEATLARRLDRLVRLLERARAVRGLRLLFVMDDADVWRLDGLEARVGPVAAAGSRVRIHRFDVATATEVLTATVLWWVGQR